MKISKSDMESLFGEHTEDVIKKNSIKKGISKETMKNIVRTIPSKPVAELLVINFFSNIKDNSDLMRCLMLCQEVQIIAEKNTCILCELHDQDILIKELKKTSGFQAFNMNFNITDEKLTEIFRQAFVALATFK